MSRSIKKRPIEVPRPILYYNFNNDFLINSNTMLLDVMGVNTGTLVGGITTGISGRTGQSFKFDGSTGYIQLSQDPTAIHTGVSGVMSLSAIININTSSDHTIIGKWVGSISSSREFFFGIDAFERVRLVVSDPDGINTLRRRTADSIPIGVDIHVAAVFDANLSGTSRILLFINGQSVVTEDDGSGGTFTQMTTVAQDFLVGSIFNTVGVPLNEMDGKIDELIWFPIALSDAQIAELSDRSLARRKAFANVPVTDYNTWWSARNIDGEGNVTLAGPEVTSWTDLGTQGADASQVAVGRNPFFRPFRFAGQDGSSRPGVVFDGIDNVLEADSGASIFSGDDAPVSVFAVLQQPTASASGSAAILDVADSTNTTELGRFIAHQTSTAAMRFFKADSGASFIDYEGPSTSVGETKAYGWYVSRAPRMSAGSVSKTNIFSFSPDTDLPPVTYNTLSIGALRRSGSTTTGENFLPGIYHELLTYSRELTETERIKLQNWAAEEYPGLDFQTIVYATNPDTTVEDILVTVNIEAAGDYPEPIAYWSFDNSNYVETTIIEQIQGANAVEVGTPDEIVGQIGQARSLDGSTEGFTVSPGTPYDFDITDPISVSVWVNIPSLGSFEPLVNKTDHPSPSSTDPGWNFLLNTSGALQAVHAAMNNTAFRRGESITTITAGQFEHVVMTYDGSNSDAGYTFYINGVDAGLSQTGTGDPGSTLNSRSVEIGKRQSTSSPIFSSGDFDEIAVWDGELTANEVAEVYARGAQGLKLVE